jgi:hypothetical protein
MLFNFKDVLRSMRLGFSAKKIWVGFLGILIGTILYSILSYVALTLMADWNWVTVWREYRFIPVPIIGYTVMPWYSWAIWIVGVALFVFVNLLAIGAISKVTFEQVKGDEFYEVTEALKFSLKNWKGIILSPLTLIIICGVVLLCGFAFGLVGRIPYLGQLVLGLLFVPIALGALFLVYLAVVLFLSFLVSPSVVGTTKSDTFDTLFEVFSILNDQTWRVVVWEALATFLSVAGIFIVAWFTKKALALAYFAIPLWQGPREWFTAMWQNGVWYLPSCPPIVWVENLAGSFLPTLLFPHTWITQNWATAFGGFCIGIGFHFIAFFVLAYGMSIWSAGQTMLYTVLVKIKDDKNLLEVKEEIEEEIKEEEEKKEEEKKEEEEEKEE